MKIQKKQQQQQKNFSRITAIYSFEPGAVTTQKLQTKNYSFGPSLLRSIWWVYNSRSHSHVLVAIDVGRQSQQSWAFSQGSGKPAQVLCTDQWKTRHRARPWETIWASSWDYGTYHIGDQTEPLLFAHMKYGSRRRVWPNIRHLAPLNGCACVFKEWVYWGWKVP